MDIQVEKLRQVLDLVSAAIPRGKVTLPITTSVLFSNGKVTATGGKWATRKMCQDRLRLKQGDTQVAFDAVDRLWRVHGSRYLGEDARRLRIRTFYAETPYQGQKGQPGDQALREQ